LNQALLEQETPLGYVAILRRQNWERHEARRLELRGQADHVGLTCESPDIVIRTDDGCDHFYRRGFGEDRLSGHYLHVLVRAFPADGVEDEHIVVTAWFTRVLMKGEVVWPSMP
jgi:hypothetical protein